MHSIQKPVFKKTQYLRRYFAVVICTISLLVLNIKSVCSSLLHNIGMLNISASRSGIPSTNHQTFLVKADQQLGQAIQIDRNDVISRVWLASIRMDQSLPAAAQLIREAQSLSHRPLCYINHLDPLRLYSHPKDFVFTNLVSFDHPQSSWQFFSHYLNKNESVLSFSETSEKRNCIARIHTHHQRFDNHFSSLQQAVQLKLGQSYQFAATIRAYGIETAWMGIASAWGGQPIINTETWQTYLFNFTSSITQPETVLFVVEAGHGILEIKDVSLIALD